jgi:hypothetical protein
MVRRMVGWLPISLEARRSPVEYEVAVEKAPVRHLDALHGVAIFLAAFAVLISRHPSALFHPRFLAEDGSLWFADAYNHGWWRMLFCAYRGYLHLIPRIGGALAQLVPLGQAPLVESLIAIAMHALPVPILLSPRLSPWGSVRFRAALAALYLCLPDMQGVIGCLATVQWPLALCSLLLLTSEVPSSRSGRWTEGASLGCWALTGPFSIFLAPMAAFLAWRTRNRWRYCRATVSLGACAQVAALLTHRVQRVSPPLGASFSLLARILSQAYLSALLGASFVASHLSLTAIACIAVAGTAILLLAVWMLPTGMRLMILLSALIVASLLASPSVLLAPGQPAWPAIAAWPGSYYWMLPSLSLLWSLAWFIRSGRQSLQVLGFSVLPLLLIGLARDYRIAAIPDAGFTAAVTRFEAAPGGSVVVIPGFPSWFEIRLEKH